MSEAQIIYPVERLLANPKVFFAIANYFEGPDWEIFSSAFYDLIEQDIIEAAPEEAEFSAAECCFRVKPENPEIFQVIMSNGSAIELRPSPGGDSYNVVESEDDLVVVSAIYGRLVKAIEEARPDLKGNIALTDVPCQQNGYLRDKDGDAFRGSFHLLEDENQHFDFIVKIIDLNEDDLKAEVSPKV